MTIEMKRIFLTLAVLMTFVSAYAQEEDALKANEPIRSSLSVGTSFISMSGLGNNQSIGPLFSMRYSSVFGKNGNWRTNVGVVTNFNNITYMPITVTNVLFPQSKHHIEYGGGIILRRDLYSQLYGPSEGINKKATDIAGAILPISYIYEGENGFSFEIGVTFMYNNFQQPYNPMLPSLWMY